MANISQADRTRFEEVMQTSEYDGKHINNLSTKRVPQELLDAIEDGCSYETLQQLAKGFPICKYRTQITIHGVFEPLKTKRVGGYVNLCQNKNKSLGVRWSAIDHDKKAELYSIIRRSTGGDWYVRQDSQRFYIEKLVSLSSKEQALQALQNFKLEAAQIDRSLFTGTVQTYGFVAFGMYYICLDVDVQTFPIANKEAIVESVTGMPYAEAKAKYDAEVERERKESEERHARYEREAAERRERERKEAEQHKAELEQWRKDNPIPEGFVEVRDYRPQKGDVLLTGIKTCGHFSWEQLPKDEWHYLFVTVTQSFGKLNLKPCNERGETERYAKGSQFQGTTINAYKKVS